MKARVDIGRERTIEAAEEVVVRRATTADAERIQDFIVANYGPSAPFKGPDRWCWQFLDNPFKPEGDLEPSVWIAVASGRVLGQIAVQDAAVWLDGDRLPAGWIVDVMVEPASRGHGLSHRIHEAILRERDLLVTLTMAPATRRVAERAGCVTLGPTGRYIRPGAVRTRTVRRYLRTKADGRPGRGVLIGAFLASRLGPAILAGAMRGAGRARTKRATPASEDFRIEEIGRFPDALDALWEAAVPNLPATFERKARFLNWRFVQCPHLSYRKFLLHGPDGALRGYAVTRLARGEELPAGVVADAFALPGDHAALDALLAHAGAMLAEADYLEAAASTPDLAAALRRAGFFRAQVMRPTVVARDPRVRQRIADSVDRWYFSKADHDWDQVHALQPSREACDASLENAPFVSSS